MQNKRATKSQTRIDLALEDFVYGVIFLCSNLSEGSQAMSILNPLFFSDEEIKSALPSYFNKTYHGSPVDKEAISYIERDLLEAIALSEEEIRSIDQFVDTDSGNLSLHLLLKAAFAKESRTATTASGSLLTCNGPPLGKDHFKCLSILLVLSVYQQSDKVYFSFDEFKSWMEMEDLSPGTLIDFEKSLIFDISRTSLKIKTSKSVSHSSLCGSNGSIKDQRTGEKIYFATIGTPLYELLQGKNFSFDMLRMFLRDRPPLEVISEFVGEDAKSSNQEKRASS